MAQIVQILAFDEDNSLNLPELLGNHAGVELISLPKSVAEVAQQLTIHVPDVILYHPSGTGDEFKHIEQFSGLCSKAAIVILANHADSDYVRQCLRAGAQDYFLTPITASVLLDELEKVYNRNLRRQKKETLSVLMDRFTGGPRLIAFASSKGGVGTTTLAVNTALALVKLEKRVVLVDLNLNAPAVDVLLHLNPASTLADLEEISMDMVGNYVFQHIEQHASGLAVLCAPSSPVDGEQLNPALLRVILQSLMHRFEYVMVDGGSAINGVMLTILEMANEFYMVSTPSLGVLKLNRNLLELLADLGHGTENVLHILNCAGVKSGVKMRHVERLLKATVQTTVAYDFGFVEQAVNQGVPFVVAKERHAISKSIADLAKAITGGVRKPKRDAKTVTGSRSASL